MRKLLLALALIVAGCSGDDGSTVTAEDADEPTTTSTVATLTERGGDVRILVASGDQVLRWVDGTVELVAEAGGAVAVAYGDGRGAVVAEVDGALVDLRSGAPMPLGPGGPGRALLFDLVTIDGDAHALYGVRDDSEGEAKGDVALLALTSGARRVLATGYAPEYHTFAGSIGGGMLAISSYSDLTESVTMYPLEDGTPEPAWSPTIDLAYNAPPLVLDAILSPDGATIAWLSGPDIDGVAPDQPPVGEWEVIVADLSGTEQTRLPLRLLDDGETAVRLDYDGARLVVSIERDETPQAPLLLDPAADTQRRLDGVTGVATFD